MAAGNRGGSGRGNRRPVSEHSGHGTRAIAKERQNEVAVQGKPLKAPPFPLPKRVERAFYLLRGSAAPGVISEADGISLVVAASQLVEFEKSVNGDREPLSSAELGKLVDILRDFGLTPKSRRGIVASMQDQKPGGDDDYDYYKGA